MTAISGLSRVGDSGDCFQQFERLTLHVGDAERDVNLLRHDDDADGREHSVHDRDGEELAQDAGAGQAEDDLEHARRHTDPQRQLVGTLRPVDLAELGDRAQGDHDQAGRGPLDRQLRVADPGGEQAANDGGEHPRDRRIAAGQRDAQAEWQSDQEDQEPGKYVVVRVATEIAERATRNLSVDLCHGRHLS